LKKKASPMSMVGFPLLLIPLAIYNIIAFLMRDVSFVTPLFIVPLTSGAPWPVTLSDILVALGILLLLLEVIKGARPGAKYLTDHLLSLVVFGGAAAEFVMLLPFGTSTYFLLTLLALVDFLSGIALRSRRGTQLAPAPTATRRGLRKPADVTPEPEHETAPVPAPTVAEPVPVDRREPTMAHPVVETSNVPSPQVPSPELQPDDGSSRSPDAPPR
jgi:hypothetical protein